MKILIAVVTCRTRRDWADLARSTWAKAPQDVDVRFFVGRGEPIETLNDEIYLECDDSYQGLPDKVREIVRWAIAHDYDYVLKCDDDVVLNIPKLLRSSFTGFDFTGHECAPKNQTPYGFNYWLSNKAMNIVANDVLPSDNNDEAWVSRAMSRNGIVLNHDDGYYLNYGRNLKSHVDIRRGLRKTAAPTVKRGDPYFAWCMHNKTVPKEVVFKEYIRIYERETQDATSKNVHI